MLCDVMSWCLQTGDDDQAYRTFYTPESKHNGKLFAVGNWRETAVGLGPYTYDLLKFVNFPEFYKSVVMFWCYMLKIHKIEVFLTPPSRSLRTS